jgi:collagen triple helix repeat protein
MFSAIRSRISPAVVVATVALVFAMSGGAYAAKRYLITSTKQISPSVLKSLKGASGKNGANGGAGAQGAAGAKGSDGATGLAGATGTAGVNGTNGVDGKAGKEGKEGEEGSPWTAGGTLPSGKSETGAWASQQFKAAEGNSTSTISFSIPLAAALGKEGVHYVTSVEVEHGGPEVKDCPGTVEDPQADVGNLCLYQGGTNEAEEPGEEIKVTSITPPSTLNKAGAGASTAGAIVLVHYKGPAEEGQLAGSWAVTAP